MSDVQKDVLSFLMSQATDRTADYVQRGRKHQNLSDAELSSAWVHAFRKMADESSDWSLRDAEQDFSSEFKLRGLELPYNLVPNEVEKFIADCDKVIREIQAEDPDRYQQASAELNADLDAYRRRRDQKS